MILIRDLCEDSAELVRADREGDRRLRLANSSPDVKALFNSPSYIYDLEEQEDSQTSLVPGGVPLDYWTPLPPIVRLDLRRLSRLLMQTYLGFGNSVTYKKYGRCLETRF